MRNLNKKYILSLLLVLMNSIWSGNVAFAQFYDDEDEIHFYVKIDGGEYCFVFNFDGERATYFKAHSEHSGSYKVNSVRKHLTKNPNYFENKVYSAVYNMTYTDKYPSTSYINIYQAPNGYSFRYLYTFSSDKSIMYRRALDSTNRSVEEFKKVPKEYFLPGRKRSSLDNEVIYE